MFCINWFKELFPQLLATVFASCTALSDGMLFSWTAPEMPNLRNSNSTFQLGKNDEMIFESVYMLSGLIALPITMYLVDKIGRQKVIFMGSFLCTIGWILIAVANRSEFIYASRVLSGMGADISFVVIPMYVSEIASEKFRGLLLGLLFVDMFLGILLMYSIGPYTPLFVPPIIGLTIISAQFSVFPFLPESPYYLMSKGKKTEAGNSLKQLRITKNNDQELERISEAIEQGLKEKGGLRDIFRVTSNRRAFWILTILVLLQQFSGQAVMIMNLHTILLKGNSIYLDTNSTGILYSSITVAAALLCALLVDKYGRKILLIVSGLFSGISMLTLAIYFYYQDLGVDLKFISWIPTAAVMTYALVFKIGLGFLPQTILTELYSNNVKTVGFVISDLTYIVSAALTIHLYEYFAYNYGFWIPFLVYAAVGFFVPVFTVLFVPETKGKTFEEIQITLKENSFYWFSRAKNVEIGT